MQRGPDYSGPVPILRPNNADIIRIFEFVNGVLEAASEIK